MMIFILMFLLYFITHLILYFGLRKSLSLQHYNAVEFPFVTIIVAAKNEEHNIGRCIESLKKLRYEKEKYEIILVNDRSEDKTKEIMLEMTEGFDEFKVIDSRKEELQMQGVNLKGKANAIDTAIENSRGDIIFTTDADCEVPAEWLIETVKYYDDKTGMVCGFTNIKKENSLFAKVQALDWIYLLSLASSSAGYRSTISCVGNNLSFRKEAYYEAGGYSSIEFSVTEDMAFMRKVNDGKVFVVKYPVNGKCGVKTEECKSLFDVFSQKRRWFRGGIGVNAAGYWMGFILFAVNLFVLTGYLFADIFIYIALLLIKFISEFLIIFTPIKVFKRKSLIKYYPIFLIYFALYGVILPITMLFYPKIRWKGRKF
jgi:cellulose synthase/poly-beta-1,6-N-acetylglucosamine synthase-like glycosyltransferase